MFFGSSVRFKSVLAAELAALLGWAALDNSDRIGGQILQAEKPVQRQIDHAFESYEESILKAQRDAAE